MPYSLTQLQAAAAHAAGRSTVDTGNSSLIMVNNALDEVCNAHPWSWRHRSGTLDFVNAQDHVDLPADFAQLRYVRGGGSVNNVAIPTTLDRIFRYRQTPQVVTGNLSIFYAVGVAPQASTTTRPTFRMEIYPTPSADATAALQYQYLRTIPPLASGSDVADIPPFLDSILMTMVRGYAEFYELNNPGPNWQIAHEQLERAKERDAMTQPIVGTLRGTVQQMGEDDSRRMWFQNPIVTIN